MPIPFSDIEGLDGLGSAAFLKLERSSDDACCLGALLVIGARGEPLEFGYNRVRVPQPFLWREADLRRYSERRLTIFTSNYPDIPDDTEPNSLLFRIGVRMRSRLHEMCEFIIMDGADYRELPAVTTFDLRVGKTFTFAITKVAIDFDVFNLFNSATVLARQYDARLSGATGFDQVLEMMNPRIARIGFRFAF